jgi:hypothetical protein
MESNSVANLRQMNEKSVDGKEKHMGTEVSPSFQEE